MGKNWENGSSWWLMICGTLSILNKNIFFKKNEPPQTFQLLNWFVVLVVCDVAWLAKAVFRECVK